RGAAVHGPPLWQRGRRLLRDAGRHPARLLDPAALQGTAGDGDDPAQLLAARARCVEPAERHAPGERPGRRVRRPSHRGVRLRPVRPGQAGGRLALQVADGDVRLVAVADRPRLALLPAREQALVPSPRSRLAGPAAPADRSVQRRNTAAIFWWTS